MIMEGSKSKRFLFAQPENPVIQQNQPRCPGFALALATAFLSPLAVFAQEPLFDGAFETAECKRPWTFRVIPYGWLYGTHGDVTVRGVTAPVDVSIGKSLDLLFHDLNFAAMGQMEARKGPVGIIFNGFYLDVSPSKRIRNLDFSQAFRNTILDLVLTYELPLPEQSFLPAGSRFELLGGFRYNALSGGLTVTGPRGNSAGDSGTDDWFDPILGARLRLPVCDLWTIQVRGDIGGFDLGEASRLTWNIEATLEYRWSDHCTLFAGYRWLDIDHRSGSGTREFRYDVNMGGPLMGLAFDF